MNWYCLAEIYNTFGDKNVNIWETIVSFNEETERDYWEWPRYMNYMYWTLIGYNCYFDLQYRVKTSRVIMNWEIDYCNDVYRSITIDELFAKIKKISLSDDLRESVKNITSKRDWGYKELHYQIEDVQEFVYNYTLQYKKSILEQDISKCHKWWKYDENNLPF